MKSESRTIFEVDYHELEREVKEAFGVDWNFAAAQEANNDTMNEFSVDGTLYDYEREEIAAFIDGTHDGDYLASALMNELCRLGRIEPGTYMVRVSW